MSYSGDGGGNGNGGSNVRPNNPNGGNANFDNTSLNSDNRDPWNNPRPQPKNQQGKNDDGNKNDDGINDDLVQSIWDKIENKDKPNDGNPGNGNGGGNNPPANQPSMEERTREYLKTVGLDGFTLTEQEKEAAANGDFGPMMNKMTGIVANAHMKGLSGSQTMIEAAVAKAVKDVTSKADANFTGHRNMEKMHDALPFTKLKAYAPVANTVLQRFLDRGISNEKAIEGVKAYFDSLAGEITGNKVNTNRNQNFQSDNQNDGKRNWLDILSPGNG